MNAQTEESAKADQPSKQEWTLRLDAIGKNILHALGRPADLHRLQVRALWDNHFRANVFTGPDFFSAKIVHSFFVVADQEGKLVSCVPTISKKY